MTDNTYSGKTWAIQWYAPFSVAVDVRHFSTKSERDAWVAQNPGRREAVGVRNPHVKAWRDRRTKN